MANHDVKVENIDCYPNNISSFAVSRHDAALLVNCWILLLIIASESFLKLLAGREVLATLAVS